MISVAWGREQGSSHSLKSRLLPVTLKDGKRGEKHLLWAITVSFPMLDAVLIWSKKNTMSEQQLQVQSQAAYSQSPRSIYLLQKADRWVRWRAWQAPPLLQSYIWKECQALLSLLHQEGTFDIEEINPMHTWPGICIKHCSFWSCYFQAQNCSMISYACGIYLDF